MEDTKLKTFDLQLFAGEGGEGGADDKGGEEQKTDEQITLTKAELAKMMADKDDEFAKKHAKDFELLEEYKSKMSEAEKEKLEVDKLRKEAQEAKEALAKIAEQQLNAKIIKETGLPDFLTAMLSGDEKERMSQAKELVKKLNNGQIGSPANPNTDSKKNANQRMNDFLRGL